MLRGSRQESCVLPQPRRLQIGTEVLALLLPSSALKGISWLPLPSLWSLLGTFGTRISYFSVTIWNPPNPLSVFLFPPSPFEERQSS